MKHLNWFLAAFLALSGAMLVNAQSYDKAGNLKVSVQPASATPTSTPGSPTNTPTETNTPTVTWTNTVSNVNPLQNSASGASEAWKDAAPSLTPSPGVGRVDDARVLDKLQILDNRIALSANLTATPTPSAVAQNYFAIPNGSETPMIAAGGSGVYNDMVMLQIANSDTAVNRFIIRDTIGGSQVMEVTMLATTTMNMHFPHGWKQTTSNTYWTVQSVAGFVTTAPKFMITVIKRI